MLMPRPFDDGLTPRIRWVVAWFASAGRLPGWVDYELVENLAHVVVFLPLAILAVVAVGRRLAWLATSAMLAIAVALEYATAAVHDGSPVSDVDLALHAVGAIAGGLVGDWALGGAASGEGRRPTERQDGA